MLLFLAVFLSAAVLDHPKRGWNVNTRLGLVFAVVEQGTFAIDAYHDRPDTRTMDKAFYEGHYYGDKAIGLPVLAIPVYAGMRLAWGAFGAQPTSAQANYWLRVLVVSTAAGLAAVLWWDLLIALGAAAGRALVAVALVVFGSLFFGYATVFYPYVPGVAAALAALHMLLLPERGLGLRRSFAIGAASGLAVLCDFIFGLIAAGVAAVFVLRVGRESGLLPAGAATRRYGSGGATARAALAASGAALALAPFVVYSLSIYGALTLHPFEHHSVGAFRTGMAEGFFGIALPRPTPLFFLTVHPLRGLLFWSPLLAAAAVGCVLLLRRAGLPRIAGALGLYAFLAYLAFNSGYYMWWGGWGMGSRLLVPLLVALPLGLAVFAREGVPRPVWAGVLLLGVVSVALSLPVSLLDPLVTQHYSDAFYRELRIGDAVTPPQFRLVRAFYALEWLSEARHAPAPVQPASVLAALVLPVVLLGAAAALLSRGRRASRATSDADAGSARAAPPRSR